MVESLDAQTEVAVDQKQAADLTLAANVAKAAIEKASLRAQIAATKNIIAVEEERLALLQRQLTFGAVAGTDLLSQQTALAQARQNLPALETRLAQQRNLLTALAGRYPSDEVDATFDLSQLSLPRELPLSLPSQVVAQRPDIKAAQAHIHSASAQIGVAVAARLPNIVLTANGGSGAFKIAQLFASGTNFYQLAGNVTQPLFDGMTLLNRQRAAEAGFDQAEAQYRSTVVNAFQNVADTLRALQGDARTVNHGGTFVRAIIASDFVAWAAFKLMPLMPDAMRMMLGTDPALVRPGAPSEKARVREVLDHLLPVSARFGGTLRRYRNASTSGAGFDWACRGWRARVL